MQASNTRFHKEINCVEGKALLINVKTGEDVAFRVTHRLASNCAIYSKVKWVSSRVKKSKFVANVCQDRLQMENSKENFSRMLSCLLPACM